VRIVSLPLIAMQGGPNDAAGEVMFNPQPDPPRTTVGG